MSQREKTYNHTMRSSKSRLRYRNYKRKHRRELNKLQDITTLEAVTVPMSALSETPQSQNGTPTGGQVRVSYDKHLPCLPQSWECDDTEKARIANGMQPILQVSQPPSKPQPYGTVMRTQNHGGKGGPAQGNLSKMRPISVESAPPIGSASSSSPDAPLIETSLFEKAKNFLSSLF